MGTGCVFFLFLRLLRLSDDLFIIYFLFFFTWDECLFILHLYCYLIFCIDMDMDMMA
jgi:hypothetical protein